MEPRQSTPPQPLESHFLTVKQVATAQFPGAPGRLNREYNVSGYYYQEVGWVIYI